MFFVIDFETSALLPWLGFPLTLGIVPVNEMGEMLPGEAHLYVEFPIKYEPDWHLPDNLSPTEKWWLDLKNSEEANGYVAFQAAWKRDSTPKEIPDIAYEIVNYFHDVEPDQSKRYICANPVAFDKMWLDHFLSKECYLPELPYHYRCLCLRSMRYGVEYGFNPEYGSSREDHEPLIPHHALHDARGEAYDLIDLMKRGRNAAENQHNLINIYADLDRRGIKFNSNSIVSD